MPGIPANITIEGRTPATIKGNLPPLINTLASARGGFRAGDDLGGGGGGSDPVGEGIDPTDGYPNAWATGSEPDWDARLARVGNGTADPTFNVDNAFTFLGAFRIPFFNAAAGGGTTNNGTFSIQSMTYRPPSGDNGPNGSVYLAAFGYVAELQIPELSMATNHTALSPTTIIQPFTNAMAKAPSAATEDNNAVGWMQIIDGRLFMSAYASYDNNGNNHPILIANDPSDLENGTWQDLATGEGDKTAKYIISIPSEKQASFGGTHLAGICASVSIMGRSSFGPSLVSMTPANVTISDTNIANTVWTFYPGGNAINGYNVTNRPIGEYYGGLLNSAPGFDLSSWYPENSACIANWGGANNQYPEVWAGLTQYCGVPVSESGGRTRTTFDGLPLPDPSLSKHVVNESTTIGCAFIPPGTNTICFLGLNDGNRYGQGYKNMDIDTGPSGSGNNWCNGAAAGYSPFSKEDADNYVWLMNTNDIAGRSDISGEDFYFSKPLNQLGPHITGAYPVVSGHFDLATNKLYVVSSGHPESKYNSQQVVSVFQVGGV